jgi:hypothetical protein
MKKSNPHPKTLYQTERLTFASYLIAAGRSQLHAVRQNGNSRALLFVLAGAPSDEDVAAFFSGSGEVSALRYSEAMANLKCAVFEAKRAIEAGGRITM